MRTDPGKPAALTDWAYATIRQAILSLEVPPGAQLRVDDLIARMGISRTPVREALLRLEADGLVRTVPRVGFFVTEITQRDLVELFELRELLESYATKRTVATMSDQDLAYIDGVLAQAESAVEQEDLPGFQATEVAFHNFFLERAQNQRLLAIMATLHDLTYRQRVLSLAYIENVRLSLAEHQTIAAALHEHDAERAGRLMAEHMAAAKRRLLSMRSAPEGQAQPAQAE